LPFLGWLYKRKQKAFVYVKEPENLKKNDLETLFTAGKNGNK